MESELKMTERIGKLFIDEDDYYTDSYKGELESIKGRLWDIIQTQIEIADKINEIIDRLNDDKEKE
jgi:hypothetical protein